MRGPQALPQTPEPAALPLLSACDMHAPFVWWRGTAVSRYQFLAHAQRLADQLPPVPYIINLCEDRYLFLVAFAAALIKGKTTLLPPSRARQDAKAITAAFPGSEVVVDEDVQTASVISDVAMPAIPQIPAAHIAVIVFTSGSTGESCAHPKRWAQLVAGAHCADQRFGFKRCGAAVVATVPAQHMYGLETSVLLPLACGVSVYGGKPLYAEDIRKALAMVPAPRALITTPIHLRVCVESELEWPQVDIIISASAPLTEKLAGAAERVFGTAVQEIYGCTEVGSIASRRRLESELWRAYNGMWIASRGDAFYACARHLPEPVALSDELVLHDPTHFELAGRQADMINIAGKRASLGDLTLKLSDVAGVRDAVFIAPDVDGDGSARLIALVVAPAVSESDILRQLAERIDPTFMPRPLYKVERLPRNSMGKLPRAELLTLVRQLKQRR